MIKEQYPHAVSGAFANQVEARKSITNLIENTGLSYRQVKLIRPDDKMRSNKVAPDSQGIFRTMISAHLWAGLIGFAIGLGVALALFWYGPGWAGNNLAYTIIVFASLGTLLMMFVGGPITPLLHRARVSMVGRDRSNAGHWTVMAHCKDRDQMAAARDQLENGSLSTYRSL